MCGGDGVEGAEEGAEGCAAAEERSRWVCEVEKGALAVGDGFCARQAAGDLLDGRLDERARRR